MNLSIQNLPFEPGDLVKVTNAPTNINMVEPIPNPFGSGFPKENTYVLIYEISYEGKNPLTEIWRIGYIHNGRTFIIVEPADTMLSVFEKVEI